MYQIVLVVLQTMARFLIFIFLIISPADHEEYTLSIVTFMCLLPLLQIGIIDPDCRLIGLHLYDGLFKVGIHLILSLVPPQPNNHSLLFHLEGPSRFDIQTCAKNDPVPIILSGYSF